MKKGFTFLEILIVIGIIAILFYVALTSFASKPDSKLILQNFTTQLVEDLRFVRQRAIITHSTDGLDLTFASTFTSYTFLDEKGNIVTRTLTGVIVNSTATIFSFDEEGKLTADNAETYAVLTLILDTYSSTININSLGFIERYGP
ncbi:MAG: prepilin-type N-terminal cleavage/methylation domain-containing protein [Dictyoglomaceae bacterium]